VIYIVYTVHVLVCLFLIMVVLLQQGKGADLSVFGGGSTQTAFGAVGATSLLHKLTVTSFVLFILTTMTIAVSQTSTRSSVVSGAETTAPTPPAGDTEGEAGAQTPAAAGAASAQGEAEPAAGLSPAAEAPAEAAQGEDAGTSNSPPQGDQNP
jgi:preprotein translocase subunit SecG